MILDQRQAYKIKKKSITPVPCVITFRDGVQANAMYYCPVEYSESSVRSGVRKYKAGYYDFPAKRGVIVMLEDDYLFREYLIESKNKDDELVTISFLDGVNPFDGCRPII